jgi:hypothetical protein
MRSAEQPYHVVGTHHPAHGGSELAGGPPVFPAGFAVGSVSAAQLEYARAHGGVMEVSPAVMEPGLFPEQARKAGLWQWITRQFKAAWEWTKGHAGWKVLLVTGLVAAGGLAMTILVLCPPAGVAVRANAHFLYAT